MKKYTLLFYLLVTINYNSFSQTFCGPPSSSVTNVFYANSSTNFASTSFEVLYLCGNNTVVYDTTVSGKNIYVYLNAGTKYYTKNNAGPANDIILAKSNSTVVILPTASVIDIKYEIGATIINLSSGAIFTYTCASLSFPIVNCASAGLNEKGNNNEGLEIYPNPTNEILNVASTGSVTELQIEIINSLGKVIKDEQITFKENKTTISTKDLANGVYVLTLQAFDSAQADKKQSVSKRFVVAR